MKILALTAVAGVIAIMPAQAQQSYRCPDAGSSMERSRGERISYRGGAANSFLCNTSTGTSRLLGYWPAGLGAVAAGRTQIEAMVTAAFAGGAPAPVSFRYTGTGSDQSSIILVENWRVLTPTRISVLAGEFNVIPIERRFEVLGSSYNFTQVVSFDRESRMPVRASVDHLNALMANDLFNWQATEVRRPQ